MHTDQDPEPPLAAVVLTGGTGRRLGGVDKAALQLGGVTLLEHALAATTDAAQTVVVGDPAPTSRPVTWARESPPGGGPAAGLMAGIDALAGRPDLVCVLAVDMPRVRRDTVDRLVTALRGSPADAAVLVDGRGVRQTLAAVYRYDALLAARPADRGAEEGLSVRRLVASLRFVEVGALGTEARDVDTWDDLCALDRPE